MSTENNKKKRGRNFTMEDEVTLVGFVESYKDILENKKSDTVTSKQKEQTWKTIADLFTASTGSSRESKTLRDKYDSLKRRAKVELAAEKSETYRTGGGLAISGVSTVSQKIAAMFGDSATGLKNRFDSDNLTSESMDLSTMIEFVNSPSNIVDSGSEHEEAQNSNITLQSQNSSPNRNQNDWNTLKPSSLQLPKSKRLCIDGQRKRRIEEVKVELILSQKKLYEEENRRAEEKHQEELTKIRLENEILRIKLRNKLNEMG